MVTYISDPSLTSTYLVVSLVLSSLLAVETVAQAFKVRGGITLERIRIVNEGKLAQVEPSFDLENDLSEKLENATEYNA